MLMLRKGEYLELYNCRHREWPGWQLDADLVLQRKAEVWPSAISLRFLANQLRPGEELQRRSCGGKTAADAMQNCSSRSSGRRRRRKCIHARKAESGAAAESYEPFRTGRKTGALN